MLTLSSRSEGGQDGGKTVCEDDVRMLTLSSRGEGNGKK